MTMHDCPDGAMRDLLPEYVHGSLLGAQLARVSAHVAACADCAAEVALLNAVRSAFPAPAVDVAGIVAALPGPSARRRGAAVRGGARPGWYAVAAGIIAVAGLSLAVINGTFRTSAGPPSVAAASGLTFDGGVADLTDVQVQTLLGEIDGLDAKPGEEPETNVGHIVPLREGVIDEG